MSRRQSVYKKQNPGKPRVRFPDELVFQDSVKENDIKQMDHMLRRASLQMDLNAVNSVGKNLIRSAIDIKALSIQKSLMLCCLKVVREVA